MSDVKITDNSEKILKELEEAVEAALEACGNQAVSHAKTTITKESRVDTGALRNSISHKVQKNVCYVGTSQSYAIYNELGTGIFIGGGRQTPWSYQGEDGEWHRTRGMKGIHFLKNAIADHIDEYKAIIKHILSNR